MGRRDLFILLHKALLVSSSRTFSRPIFFYDFVIVSWIYITGNGSSISGVIRTTLTFLQNIKWRKMRLKIWNFIPSLQCVLTTIHQRVKMQYCQKLIRFHHIRLYLDLSLCNEDLLAKICKNVKIPCTTPPMATTGTVPHTTLTFLQTCKSVKVVCVTPFIGRKNVKVWHYINFARMWKFVHITVT